VDNLRWVLLLIGVVVVAAIYVSARFSRGKSPRAASRQRDIVDDTDTQTESFSAAEEDEPGFSDWAASPTEHSTHAPDDVEVKWNETVDEAKPLPLEPQTPTEIETPKTQKAPAPAADIKPLVLVLTIMAPADRPLNGERLQAALEAEGLRHGDMNIFHFRRAEHEDAVFSVANAVEPGIFDPATMAEVETPGVTLFCQLPGPLANDAAFDLMLDKARALAARLDAHVCDDRRNALTTQTISHYHDRIETFSRELALARKKAAEK
jgi:cell division protein ZipA